MVEEGENREGDRIGDEEHTREVTVRRRVTTVLHLFVGRFSFSDS